MSATREDRLDELLARSEIVTVLTRWCRGLDRGDEALMRSTYHADAVDEHGHHMHSGVTAPRSYIERHQRAFTRHLHLVMNTLIDLDGDLAAVESYQIGMLVPRSPEPETIILSSGRFLDRLERRDDGWRFSHRRWIRESVVNVQQLPPARYLEIVYGQLATRAPAPVNPGTRSRQDPSYDYLPGASSGGDG